MKFNVRTYPLIPNKSIKESIKKLKYLKTPKRKRFINIEINRSDFLLFTSCVSNSFLPIVKSTMVEIQINERNFQYLEKNE